MKPNFAKEFFKGLGINLIVGVASIIVVSMLRYILSLISIFGTGGPIGVIIVSVILSIIGALIYNLVRKYKSNRNNRGDNFFIDRVKENNPVRFNWVFVRLFPKLILSFVGIAAFIFAYIFFYKIKSAFIILIISTSFALFQLIDFISVVKHYSEETCKKCKSLFSKVDIDRNIIGKKEGYDITTTNIYRNRTRGKIYEDGEKVGNVYETRFERKTTHIPDEIKVRVFYVCQHCGAKSEKIIINKK